jgi:ABC-type nitrate/sulfonate/bicarbonate transport system substrate-binding protein
MVVRFARLLQAFALASSLLLATGATAADKFTLILPVKDVLHYHPIYIAQEKGFFKDEGLDLTIQTAAGSSAAIRQLIAGNADAALPSPGAYLNAVARGQDLRWVYSYEFSNVFTLITPAASKINSIADLKGKKVGVSELSGGEVPLVRAVLRKGGLEEGKDVTIVPVGEGGALTIQALKTGQVDAYSSSVFDVAAIHAAGFDVRVILPKDVQDFPSNGLVATAKGLAEKKDLIAKLARGIAKGVVYSKANEERAFNLAAKISPEQFEKKELAKHQWNAALKLITIPPSLKDRPLGTHYVEGFANYHGFLRAGKEEEGALPKEVDLKKALDNSIIADANKFDVEAVKKMK